MTVSRRTFLAGIGGVTAAAGLAACSSPGSGPNAALGFWNMPWGGTAFNPLDESITEAYDPPSGMPSARYQVVQWAGFPQTFASAIASKTGPAVSSGSGTQAFQFAEQGVIAYADDLLEKWKDNGLYDDFLPGILDTMKTEAGYAAVPYNLDMRVLWYSRSLLERAGAEVPTDWQSYLDACEALKKNDVYGFALAAGAQGNGFQMLVGLMINNGGGIFDEEQRPNLVTKANTEALDFVVEMIEKGYVDPGSAAYSTTNAQAQWKDGRFGMGFEGPGLANQLGGAQLDDVVVGEPLTSASGEQGALYFPNNIMMYTATPSQEGSEDFLTYYYQNMAPLWTENTGIGLPVLRSIADTDEFRADLNAAKCIEVWQPVSKTWAAPGGNALFSNVTLIDSTEPMTVFAQSLVSGQATPTEALTALQDTLDSQLAAS